MDVFMVWNGAVSGNRGSRAMEPDNHGSHFAGFHQGFIERS